MCIFYSLNFSHYHNNPYKLRFRYQKKYSLYLFMCENSTLMWYYYFFSLIVAIPVYTEQQ